MDEPKVDLPTTGSDLDFAVASRQDVTLATVCKWVQSGAAPAWSECLGLSSELRCWQLQVGNLSVDKEVAMDFLDMSVATPKGNRYDVLVMVDCFSRWTEACLLPNKTALAVADAFFQHIVCRFVMPSVIHSIRAGSSRII